MEATLNNIGTVSTWLHEENNTERLDSHLMNVQYSTNPNGEIAIEFNQ